MYTSTYRISNKNEADGVLIKINSFSFISELYDKLFSIPVLLATVNAKN